MHDSPQVARQWKNNRYVLFSELMHVSHVTNGYLFIVELKLDKFNISAPSEHLKQCFGASAHSHPRNAKYLSLLTVKVSWHIVS